MDYRAERKRHSIDANGQTSLTAVITDSLGRYILNIPESMQAKTYTVSFTKKGFEFRHEMATPQIGGELDIKMKKLQP